MELYQRMKKKQPIIKPQELSHQQQSPNNLSQENIVFHNNRSEKT